MSSRHNAGFVRIFDQARTAHFERLSQLTQARFVYRRRSYDFDPAIARPHGEPRTRWATVLLLVRERPSIVELNEPGAINTWPSTVLYVTVLRTMNLLRLSRCRVVVYAIENADPVSQISGRLRLPHRVAKTLTRLIFRLLLPRGSRIAFGTAQARDQYVTTLPSIEERAETRLFDPLAPPCESCFLEAKDPYSIIFVGALEPRKGVRELMRAWPEVAIQEPRAALHVLGKGPLEQEVLALARSRADVSITLDPSRSEIHAALARAKCLTLPSRRDGYWREQIGLPILEGLSHGCEIVATAETGVAGWLDEHGHRIVPVETGASPTLARQLADALRPERSARDVLRDLPEVDGRRRADEWLFRG